MEHEFPALGRKKMRLNARQIKPLNEQPALILLAVEEVMGEGRHMNAEQTASGKLSRLRQRAEAVVAEQSQDLSDYTPQELQRLVNELKVHQVELELQNEELRSTQFEWELVQENYVELYDSASVGYVTLDEDGLIVEANLTGADLLGKNRSALVGQRLSRFVAPEHQDAYHFYRRRLAKTDTLQREEIKLLKADGSHFYARLHGRKVIQPGQAGVQHNRIVISDITEQVQVEHARQETHNFISAVLDTAGALIVIIDREGRVVRFNRACEQLSGYSFEEVQGQPIWDVLLLPEEQAPVKAVFEQLCAGRFPNEFENHWVARDGSRHLISWSNTALPDAEGVVQYVIGIGIDMTGRKQAEVEIEQSHRWLERIAHTTPDIIFVLDIVHNRNVYANRSILEILGYSPEEFGQLPDILQKVIAPDDLLQTQEFYRTMVDAKPGEVRLLTHRSLHKDGSMRWIENRVTPFRWDENGHLREVIGLAHDITERKRVEAERERLFQEVSQQREQLRAVASRLAEAQEVERKELARELHDRIGQNLAGLGLDLNIIRSQLAGTPFGDGPVQARLDDSLALVAQITEQVRDVMANLRPPVLDDYGLAAALRWYGDRLAERTGLTIVVQGEERLPRLAAPLENTLFRIAQEALTNVAKHAWASEVIVTLGMDDGKVRLVIADDGCGFDLTRLVDLEGSHGWGVLTMTERAEAVGARFRIESSPGQGTKVIVEVPPSASSEN